MILYNFMGFKRLSANSQTSARWKSGGSLMRHDEGDLPESVALNSSRHLRR